MEERGIVWLGLVMAGTFGVQEMIIEIGSLTPIIVGILVIGGISSWIVYKLYWRKKTQKMRPRGLVSLDGGWMAPEDQKKISKILDAWSETEDPQIGEIKRKAEKKS